MVNIGAVAENPLHRGTAMKAEPLQHVSVPISQQPKDRSRSGANEQAIQACCDLLSSGQPLSEILVAVKQLGPLNNAPSDFGGAPDQAQISGPVDEMRGALPQWAIAQVAEPPEASRSLVLLNIEPSRQRARHEGKWSRTIAVVLFWLIPAMSIILMGIAGKLSIDAGLMWKSGSATAVIETVAPSPAITEVGRPAADQPQAARDPATQAAITAPANNQDRGPRIQDRPAVKSSSRPTSRPAQQPSTEFYRSSPKEWRIPPRLTDGL
jgi:hypothetical protein